LERGLITSPKYQGIGGTATIEKEILDELPPEKYSVITAKVKHTNLRSLKYHEKVGYEFDGRSDDYVLYKKVLK
jgi:RimJ/RimL family protein N-acetyltransferase